MSKAAIALQRRPKLSSHQRVQVGLAHYQALYHVVFLLHLNVFTEDTNVLAGGTTHASEQRMQYDLDGAPEFLAGIHKRVAAEVGNR